MATAKKKPKDDYVVELTLSPEEARFLRDVMANIGGDVGWSRRKYATDITDALEEVGFRNVGTAKDLKGCINFDSTGTRY